MYLFFRGKPFKAVLNTVHPRTVQTQCTLKTLRCCPLSAFAGSLQCWGSSGKKVVFHHRLDLLFVAAFPNAVIKNNNTDNSVPSTKQLTEIPTSPLLKNGIHAPALLPSSGCSRRRFLTHLSGSYYIFTKEK